jgi:hypothetical protein
MPRFRLTIDDAADLVAYLREIGSRPDPGVSADMLSIGILLAPRGNSPAVSDAVGAALGAYGEQLNSNGGIFGRRIKFTLIEAATDPDGSPPAARAAAIEQAVLAAVGAVAGTEHDIAVLARQSEMPLITLHADIAAGTGRQVFHLGAGVGGELRALAAQAARQLDASHAQLTILYRHDDHGRDPVGWLWPVIERDGWQSVDEVRLPADGEPNDLPEELFRRIGSADALLVATPYSGIGTLLSALGKVGRNPLVLLPGSTTAPQWLPPDLSPHARILLGFELAGLHASPTGERGLPQLTQPVQHTLAAAQLVVEGLRRAGRDVTRAKLVDAIETIQRFETGYLPPLSYAPRQHIGFTGAQIVPFDPLRRQLIEPLGRIEFID